MDDIDRPTYGVPLALEYEPAPRKASAARVLAKTALVFTGLGSILFTVLGFFGIVLARLPDAHPSLGVWAVAVSLLIVAAIFVFATQYLSNVGKPNEN
jgi:O-antigen/teichoic acid export membrane protein